MAKRERPGCLSFTISPLTIEPRTVSNARRPLFFSLRHIVGGRNHVIHHVIKIFMLLKPFQIDN